MMTTSLENVKNVLLNMHCTKTHMNVRTLRSTTVNSSTIPHQLLEKYTVMHVMLDMLDQVIDRNAWHVKSPTVMSVLEIHLMSAMSVLTGMKMKEDNVSSNV